MLRPRSRKRRQERGQQRDVTEVKPMNQIKLSGKSLGKGRNGYFQLHGVEVMNMPTDPDGQVLHVDFYPRRRVNYVGPARLLLSLEDAMNLAQYLRETIENKPKEGNIERGDVLYEGGHRGPQRRQEWW